MTRANPAWTWADYARCARAEAARADAKCRKAPLEARIRQGMLVITVGVSVLADMFSEAVAQQDTAPAAPSPTGRAGLTGREREQAAARRPKPAPPLSAGDAPAPAETHTSAGTAASAGAARPRAAGEMPPPPSGKPSVPEEPMPCVQPGELPGVPDGPTPEHPLPQRSDPPLPPAGDAAKPAGDVAESAQMRRARELIAMGLHVNDVCQAVKLSKADLEILKQEAAK